MPIKRMLDNMVDIEAGGNAPGCVIFSIGAVFFDPQVKKLGTEFYRVVNAASCEAVGLRYDDDTMAWWKDQSEEAQAVLKMARDRNQSVSITRALKEFSSYLHAGAGPGVQMYGCGNDYDVPCLTAAYKACGLPIPWEFRNSWCYRTLKNLPGAREHLPVREGVFHNALDDAKHQARGAIELLSRIKFN